MPPLLLIQKGVRALTGVGLKMLVNAPEINCDVLFGFTAMLGSEFCCCSPLCEKGMTSTRVVIVVTGPACAMPARAKEVIIATLTTRSFRRRIGTLLDDVFFAIFAGDDEVGRSHARVRRYVKSNSWAAS